MRPKNVDSNAYSYHLKILIQQKLIEKHLEKGYRLSPRGMAYVDRMSISELDLRVQPKIITMAVLYNEYNQMLLFAKSKQPFIGAWTFVSGKLHIDDAGARNAAIREINERTGVAPNATLAHVADVYIHASINKYPVSTVLSHVFTMHIQSSEVVRTDVLWTDRESLTGIQTAPGIKEISALVNNENTGFIFAEYSIDW